MDNGANRGRIVFDQRVPPFARVVLAAFGLFTFIAPYELLIRPGRPVFTLAMIPFWFIALGALSVGAVCLIAGVFGPTRTVTFDPTRRLVTVRAGAAFGLRYDRSYPFARLGTLGVHVDTSTDGPPRYRAEAAIAGRKRPLEIDTFDTEAEADAALTRVRACLAGESV